MNFNKYTIVLTGLGGQGLISLIQILGHALMIKGYKVITSETHGLSQRGGRVTCFLRFGENLQAPIPMIGTADMIISLEKSCILDALKFINPDRNTRLIISTYKSVLKGSTYPSDDYINAVVKNNSKFVHFIEPTKIAGTLADNLKTVNTVILGYTSRFLSLGKEELEFVLRQHFSGSRLDLNLKALKAGLILNDILE